jgi:transposase
VPDGVDDLPDDPAELKRLLLEKTAQLEQVRHEAAEQLEAQRLRLEAEKQAEVKAAVDAVLRRFYGPRSESFDPRQLLIFGLAMAEDAAVDPAVVKAESGETLVTRRIVNRHKHGRGKLPDHLPRIELVHDLSDEQKKCPGCNQPRACIGSEDSEQLEFIPASFKVIVHKRMKYACRTCDADARGANIAIADKPEQPIDKGLPGPGLLAHVIVGKLGDHLPLYRLEQIFARQDVQIARSTMCAWMLACSDLVKPLVELMSDRVRQGKVIHTDDTRVPVQDDAVKGKCKSGRIWTYLGDKSNPYVVYDYTPDRTRAGPLTWLARFKGYLQADAYGGYDGIYTRGDVTEVACWAHARRKFFDARETDGRRSAQMLEFVRQLYAIEDEAKALDHDSRRDLRQQKSRPILEQIKTWLDTEQPIVLPRSPMGAAITYTLNQWTALTRYTDQGFLNIDNNAAERALKRVAIGRKNWLFAGHDQAGASHARLYTLIASAERHGLDPQRYLTSVLAKIGQAKLSEVEQFLPDVWKADDVTQPSGTSAGSQ